jgi:hypothetical protein
MLTSEQRKKRMEEIAEERDLFIAEQDLKNIKSNASRARGVTVGTAFGGVTEISMRGEGGEFLWSILQPVEVTELIHQLAGNIGCHINIQPRRDFASWRDWRITDEEKLHLNGHPPHPNDMSLSMNVGISLPAEMQEEIEKISRPQGFGGGAGQRLNQEPSPEMMKELEKSVKNNDKTMATEKPANKRRNRGAPSTP